MSYNQPNPLGAMPRALPSHRFTHDQITSTPAGFSVRITAIRNPSAISRDDLMTFVWRSLTLQQPPCLILPIQIIFDWALRCLAIGIGIAHICMDAVSKKRMS